MKKSQVKFEMEKGVRYTLGWLLQPIFLSRVLVRSSVRVLQEHLLEVDVKQQDCPSDRATMKNHL